MKSILLHIDGDSCMEARMQVALDIARATNGHITCLQAVSYEVFAQGWLQDDTVGGRPADIIVAPDGSLLVSDDKGGRIYRISYAGAEKD